MKDLLTLFVNKENAKLGRSEQDTDPTGIGKYFDFTTQGFLRVRACPLEWAIKFVTLGPGGMDGWMDGWHMMALILVLFISVCLPFVIIYFLRRVVIRFSLSLSLSLSLTLSLSLSLSLSLLIRFVTILLCHC
jgi:hypothetical protein